MKTLPYVVFLLLSNFITAQATQNFEDILFLKWSSEFIDYKAIIIYNEQPEDPYQGAGATVRVSFEDNLMNADRKSGIYEYHANFYRNTDDDGNLEITITPKGFAKNRKMIPETIIKGDASYEKLHAIKFKYNDSMGMFDQKIYYRADFSMTNLEFVFDAGNTRVHLINEFYSEEDELYSELLLHAEYLKYLEEGG